MNAKGERLGSIAVAALTAVLLAGALVAGVLLAIGNSGRVSTASVSLRAAPSGAGASSGSVSTSTFSVTPPGGWDIVHRSTIGLDIAPRSEDALLHFESSRLKNPLTSTQLLEAVTSEILQKNPDTKVCSEPATGRVPNGPPGVGVGLCFTVVPQQGMAVRVVQVIVLGTTARPSAAYDIELVERNDKKSINRFNKVAVPVIRTVHWKLFGL
jgi:hypothetical protein